MWGAALRHPVAGFAASFVTVLLLVGAGFALGRADRGEPARINTGLDQSGVLALLDTEHASDRAESDNVVAFDFAGGRQPHRWSLTLYLEDPTAISPPAMPGVKG